MSLKKYFISGGGTGGHIYPALTVALKLLKEEDTEKIYFVGNPENLEYEIIKNHPEIEFLPVKITGMPRKIGISLLKWLIMLIRASLKTIKYIKNCRPDAIFTTGGYVSSPCIAGAVITKTPFMIHDCDSVPGLVSKIAAPMADIVSVAFENSKAYLKSSNIIFNGNPVRDSFFEVTKSEAREKLNIDPDKKVLFITGGSQGAKTINDAMTNILKILTRDLNVCVIWQTGKKKYDEVISEIRKVYPEFESNKNVIIRPYIEETVYPLKAADIVISRAGSLSLTEIMLSENPSILIPYPYAAQDHQRKNAREISEKCAALYLEDSECNSDTLLDNIKQILFDNEKVSTMKKNIGGIVEKNPTEAIVKQLKSIIK